MDTFFTCEHEVNSMSIDASEIWIVESSNSYNSGGRLLSHDMAAPESFESMDSVEEYIQSNYDIGEYRLLRPERTVEVTPKHEMFADYSEADIEEIEAAREKLSERDDVLSAIVVDEPQNQPKTIEVEGSRIQPTAFECDLSVRALLNGRDIEEVVSEISGEIPELRLLGWASENYYESRGARAEDAVRILFVSDIGSPLSELRDAIETVGWASSAWPNNEALTYIPQIGVRQSEGDAVVISDIPVETGEAGVLLEGMGAVENVKEAYDEEAREGSEAIEDETSFILSGIGAVPSVESESLYWLALGYTNTDSDEESN